MPHDCASVAVGDVWEHRAISVATVGAGVLHRLRAMVEHVRGQTALVVWTALNE